MELIRAWNLKRKEDAERRRVKAFLSTAVVVFHCTEEQTQAIDVSVGPCVDRIGPRGGRLRPLASPGGQMSSDTLTHLTALYMVLTGRPAVEALEELRKQGPGTLARLSDRFAAELVSLGTPTRGVEATIAIERAVAARWFASAQWSSRMQVEGVAMRVMSFTGTARLAHAKGHPLYCWHGPAVPEYVIAHGVGEESYEAYKRKKRR